MQLLSLTVNCCSMFYDHQNLKKSWHPLTMQNLERVWKAEQRDEAERKRIAELQAEIREERAREEMQQMAVESGVTKWVL